MTSSPTPARGRFLARPDAGALRAPRRAGRHRGAVHAAALPAGAPGAVIQAGDSDGGREFAAEHADGIFTRHGRLEDGRAFYADVKTRMRRYGRAPDELLILPGVTFVLADTDEEAREQAARSCAGSRSAGRRRWCSSSSSGTATCPATTRTARCPTSSRSRVESTIAPGSIPLAASRDAARRPPTQWRAEATAENLSIRDLMVRRARARRSSGIGADRRRQDGPHVQDARVRRVHPRAAHHARTAWTIRRRGRPAAAGARLLPHRVHGHDAARAPRADTAMARRAMMPWR